jgi:uncharacterized protein (TIGR03435 family)
MISGLVAHLLQATLFAGAAWLMNLALRKNHAEVRYWVWFAASAKFLVPFSLLAGLGAFLPRRAAAPPAQGWMAAAEEIAQPLTTLPAVAGRVAAAADGAHRHYFAVGVLALWASGFAAIAVCWLARWRRVHALRRSATPLDIPGGLGSAVPVMSAPGLVEPGIFGIFRPVLLLPERIGEALDRAQLDAILAHEFCHVRRHDNLTAGIHMASQAIFWFHPLVWWLGARLVEERERACDEEVVRLGSNRRVYAEGILNICKLYLESSLVCVSGVTGANLKKRIKAIMSNRNPSRLNFPGKMALVAAGLAALGAPVAVGFLNAPAIRAQSPQVAQSAAAAPAFEVASIKLNTNCNAGGGRPSQSPVTLNLPCVPLRGLIRMAYSMVAGANFPSRRLEVLGGPGWLDTDQYDIVAKAAGNASPTEMMGPMLQTLLEERFKVKVHKEFRDAPVYELTLAKNSPRLQPSKDGSCVPMDLSDLPRNVKPGDPMPKYCGFGSGRSTVGGLITDWYAVSMAEYAGRMLSNYMDRPVIDKTGLTGRFDIHLEFAPENAMPGTVLLNGVERPDLPTPSNDAMGPSIFNALLAQLGLKLSPAKGPVEVIVIDRAEKPSAN